MSMRTYRIYKIISKETPITMITNTGVGEGKLTMKSRLGLYHSGDGGKRSRCKGGGNCGKEVLSKDDCERVLLHTTENLFLHKERLKEEKLLCRVANKIYKK